MNLRVLAGVLSAVRRASAGSALPALRSDADRRRRGVCPPTPAAARCCRRSRGAPGLRPAAAAPLPNGDLVGVKLPFVGIGLQDAIAMALQRNTDLAISRLEPAHRQLSDRRRQGRRRRAFQVQPDVFAQHPAGVNPLRDRAQRGAGHADLRRRLGRLHRANAHRGRYSLSGSATGDPKQHRAQRYNTFYQTAIA